MDELTGAVPAATDELKPDRTRKKNMGIIKAFKLGFDYLKYDEDGNVEATQRAVNDVNLDIEAGDFVAVLGHNGSGKSTLAKQINALLIPSEGTMWVDDMDTAKEPELWRSGRVPEWSFRIRTTRSLVRLWKRM